MGKANRIAISVQSALPVAELLWPRFFEFSGCVFVECAVSSSIVRDWKRGRKRDWTGWTNRTEVESLENHLHVLDALGSARDVWDQERRRYRRRHPDFKAAERLALVMTETWSAKLKQDFPSDRFRVYFTRLDNPVVRFHRVYPGEPVYLSEQDFPVDVAKGNIRVVDTGSG